MGRAVGAVVSLPFPERWTNGPVPPSLMTAWMNTAGVELYSRAASLGVLQDAVNTNKTEVLRLRDQAAHSQDPQERAAAEKTLVRIADTEKIQQEVRAAVIGRLRDPRFLAGSGSQGGEEFLSYMNLGESLVIDGGAAWKYWDSRMTASLDRVQNGDGSWSGRHCITGRTFCTATALLTLMADRTPVPVPVQAAVSAPARK
jgi:hypothetical protein